MQTLFHVDPALVLVVEYNSFERSAKIIYFQTIMSAMPLYEVWILLCFSLISSVIFTVELSLLFLLHSPEEEFCFLSMFKNFEAKTGCLVCGV